MELRQGVESFGTRAQGQSLEEFVAGLAERHEGLAMLLNRWFADVLSGRQITAEGARDCIASLPSWWSYFVSVAVAGYRFGSNRSGKHTPRGV